MTTNAAVQAGTQPAVNRLARAISTLFHPFSVTVSTPFLIVYLDKGNIFLAMYWAGWYALTVVLPALIYLLIKLKRNEFSDADVSVREQRKPFYYFGGALLLLYFVSTLVIPAPRSLSLLTASAICTVLSFGLVTHYITKISIHVGVIVGFAVASLYFSTIAFAVLIVIAALVTWSRLVLNRHTMVQVLLSWLVSSMWVLLFYSAWL